MIYSLSTIYLLRIVNQAIYISKQRRRKQHNNKGIIIKNILYFLHHLDFIYI